MNRYLWPALLALSVGTAAAQTAAPPASKEIVERLLKLHEPGVANMGRLLAEQPAQQLMINVRAAMQRVPADKREALAKEIEGDFRHYVEEAVPVVSERAVKLAPATLGPMFEQRFSEEELRQLATLLESPVLKKYQGVLAEMNRALGEKIVAESKAAVEPKVQALQRKVSGRLQAAIPKSN